MAEALGIILLKIVGIVVAAKLAGELAERVKQPAVLGELLAGVLLGPSLLGLADFSLDTPDNHLLLFLADMGAVVLLLEVGLETKLKDMLSVGASAGLVALVGIVGSFAAGFGASWFLGKLGLWGTSTLFHVFVGATFTATSVGITARVLSDMGRLATAEARTILGAAVLDDVGGLLILAFVSALAAGAVSFGALAVKAGLAVGVLVLALILGVRIAPWALDRLSRAKVRGLLAAAAFAFALLLAWAAESTGLAAIVGAFTAGLILAQTRQQAALHEKMRTLGDILVPVFFVYVGMQVDLRGVGGNVAPMLLAAAALVAAGIVGKLVSGLAVLEKGTSRLAVGVGMIPRGEVGLIFALVGLTTIVDGAPLVAGWEYTALLLAIAVTTFLTPLWLKRVLARAAPAGPDLSAVVADTDSSGQAVFRAKPGRPKVGPGWDGKRER
ncbi:MAG TPA: cation:proton antiporter [Candidatus Thermoplasmatota archaeon]|nr:cation:proton antiporter [Candidatus Thermoplasmatota archaeon]